MGLNDLSLKWLIALTVNGEKVAGFEYEIVMLMVEWLNEVLDVQTPEHRLALPVLQFCRQIIK